MAISENVVLGDGVQIFHTNLVNLYGCTIGANTKIGTFVEVQKVSILVLCAKYHRTASFAKGSQ